MNKSIYKKLDWYLIGSFFFLIIFGWMNIYAALRSEDSFIFDFSQRYGMHLIWIGFSVIIASVILFTIPVKIYNIFAWWFYLFSILLLIAVIFLGVEIKGSRSWLEIGSLRLQPAEFSKIATSLALAALMGKYGFRFRYPKDMIKALLTVALPVILIILEKETGSALVYAAFMLIFYREGMSGWILVFGIIAIILFILTLVYSPFVSMLVAIGIIFIIYSLLKKQLLRGLLVTAGTIFILSFIPKGLELLNIDVLKTLKPEIWLILFMIPPALYLFIRSFFVHAKDKILRYAILCLICGITLIYSVEFLFDKVLQDHQRARIESLLGIREDPMGVGYNVHQSMIAIGSGGFTGKGFLNGTQTRFDFVPEQGTDFIFCTIGEEWGFVGAIIILAVYLLIIIRIYNSAEKHKDSFIRIYGYCVASCILIHVIINICMTIGLMPVIGIPLPFLSYGGSSLLAFTILLFIFIRLDLERWR